MHQKLARKRTLHKTTTAQRETFREPSTKNDGACMHMRTNKTRYSAAALFGSSATPVVWQGTRQRASLSLTQRDTLTHTKNLSFVWKKIYCVMLQCWLVEKNSVQPGA